MENEARELVDLYIPRKCSETNDILAAKDHACIQLNIVDVDANGVRTNTFKTYAICGRVRRMGQSDDSIMRLAQRDAIMPKKM
ncbi:small ribosomal subunit protein eS21-like [Symsagittifera roscoffensis]|uniref:small ribosomal subunit protein eS21-like n=1 Tax=Symsagittifera roscoffensis TaxID=84072 RepID=UPI00307B4EAA